MGGCNAGGGEVPSGNDDRSGDSEPVGEPVVVSLDVECEPPLQAIQTSDKANYHRTNPCSRILEARTKRLF